MSDVFSHAAPPPEIGVCQLYLDHFETLRRYLVSRLNCLEAGQEAAQDIFLRLLLKPPPTPMENPRAFLLKTARHVVIDLARANKGLPMLLPLAEEESVLLDPVSDPARIVDARRRLRLLAAHILALPPRSREVFFLCRFEGLRQAEIALRLGISAKTVEKHLAGAMVHLRRRWVE